MKTPLCTFFISFILPVIALARLGETEQQLTARFGEPFSRSKEITLTQGKIVDFGSHLTYRQGDWLIECSIIEGRSARESYYKPGDWTEDQFITVLTSNGQGERWTDVSKEQIRKLFREWRRNDGATAEWHLGQSMIVTNPAYLRAKEQAEAKAKADAGRIPKI
jgi:hypothetical protein